MSLVFQNIDPHPPLRPKQRRGIHTRRAERGVGVRILVDERHRIVPSYSNNLFTGRLVNGGRDLSTEGETCLRRGRETHL
jgi:hypothetical protein